MKIKQNLNLEDKIKNPIIGFFILNTYDISWILLNDFLHPPHEGRCFSFAFDKAKKKEII